MSITDKTEKTATACQKMPKVKRMSERQPLKRKLFFCTPCDMETEHYAAEGYWNCHACGASITLEPEAPTLENGATLGELLAKHQPQGQHSPLPWQCPGTDGDDYVICYNDKQGKRRTVAHAYSEDNAKLIVASVNNAGKLAEELRNVLKYGSAGNENLIREALARWESEAGK